jgi:type II secretory pathway pseudopilin PulG
MNHRSRGFTLVEAVAAATMVVLLLLLLMPIARRQRLADGLNDSLNNVRQILIAQAQFHLDTGQMPMRGSRYNFGQLQGWDTWNFGGKNNRLQWSGVSGGVFDESAYSRWLNSYLYPDVGIPRPSGYVNTGSGSTWTFSGGLATSTDRANLQLPIFRSPGDVASYQGSIPGSPPYGSPNPAVTCYNDVGTSYHLNMVWWSQPDFAALSFTQRYNAGVARIGSLASSASLSTFVWISDQVGQLTPSGINAPGEFGGTNRSVCGFLDLHANYVTLTPGASSAAGYTFFIPPPPSPPPSQGLDELQAITAPSEDADPAPR